MKWKTPTEKKEKKKKKKNTQGGVKLFIAHAEFEGMSHKNHEKKNGAWGGRAEKLRTLFLLWPDTRLSNAYFHDVSWGGKNGVQFCTLKLAKTGLHYTPVYVCIYMFLDMLKRIMKYWGVEGPKSRDSSQSRPKRFSGGSNKHPSCSVSTNCSECTKVRGKLIGAGGRFVRLWGPLGTLRTPLVCMAYTSNVCVCHTSPSCMTCFIQKLGLRVTGVGKGKKKKISRDTSTHG